MGTVNKRTWKFLHYFGCGGDWDSRDATDNGDEELDRPCTGETLDLLYFWFSHGLRKPHPSTFLAPQSM